MKDVELARKLASAQPPHMSPFEHVATPRDDAERSGNFRGWTQLRKTMTNECVPEV